MAKKPKITLSVGQQVKLRGRPPFGTLSRVDDRGWAWVNWSSWCIIAGPKICHIDELEAFYG